MITEYGIWSQKEADEIHDRSSSTVLPYFLATIFNGDLPVIDFGCGKGRYIARLRNLGYNCTGVEGSALNNFEHPNILLHNLCLPLDTGLRGNVISLEVGEHLPREYEQTFLNTITLHCTGKLVTSWALPNQPGVGHVNCRPQHYIIKEIERRGFKYLPQLTEGCRSIMEDNCDWFRRTLLIFDKI